MGTVRYHVDENGYLVPENPAVQPFRAKLEQAAEQYDSRIYAIADEVRAKLVIPFCKKHGCRFMSGMGTYFFYDGGEIENVSLLSEWPYEVTPEVKEVFDALRLDFNNGQVELGEVVRDYSPEEVG